MPGGPGSPLAEKPGFLKPRLPGRRSWAPAGPSAARPPGRGEQWKSLWQRLHLEGLSREHDTVNLEQTFILCAGLVGPWPQVSGN